MLVGYGAQMFEEAGCRVFQSMRLIDYHHQAEERERGEVERE